MRLTLAVLALFVVIAEAAPRGDRLARAERVRERVRKAIAYLKSAQAFGEYAINTPYGIIPVADITEDNIPDVFRFRREFDELKKEGILGSVASATVPVTATVAASVDAPAKAVVAESKDALEGSGDSAVEGSGHSNDEAPKTATKTVTQAIAKPKRDTVDEPLLTPEGAQSSITSWHAAPGKF